MRNKKAISKFLEIIFWALFLGTVGIGIFLLIKDSFSI
jgi:hypothetical protein